VVLPGDDNSGSNNGGSNNGGSNNGDSNNGDNSGNTDNNGDSTTLPGPTDDNNTDDQDDMFTDLPEDDFSDDVEADEGTKNQLKLILLIIVVALMFGLYVISKTSDDDELLTSQNSVVDKIWDDDELNDTTMPETVQTEDKAGAAKSIDIKDKVASAMKSSGLSAVRLFTAIDQTNDGYVSRREIRTAVNTLLKDSVKVSDIDAMLETFDGNGDGVISLDEFLSVMEEHEPKQFVPVLPDLKPPGKKK
jgi:hypothetical protein